MKYTIPKALEMGKRVKSATTQIDAAFNSLPLPPVARPNDTPGQLLAKMSESRPNYTEAIRDIWSKSLEGVAEVEDVYREVDDYAQFLNECMWHIQEGNEITKELDTEIAAAARTIRRAFVAGVITRDESNALVQNCRDDLRDSLKQLEDQSGFTKRYRRAAKKALMAKTNQTIDAILRIKGSALSRAERSQLARYQKSVGSREALFSAVYKQTYYRRKGGYRTDIPGWGFKSLRALT